MDDKTNGKFARPPKIEDLIRLCRELNKHGVKYILIGGFAVNLHGYVRGTKDIDFLVDSSEENIRKIKKALAVLPDNAVSQMKDDEVQKYTVVRIGDEIVVDLMARACGIDYETAKDQMDFYEIEDLEIPVASRKLLIKLKNTARPSDRADVEFLKASLEADKNK